MKVLLVEDDAKLSKYIKKGLKESGYVVDTAKNGEEALLFTESSTYDVMIVDIMLPGMDGLTFIEKIREKGIKTPFSFSAPKDPWTTGLRASTGAVMTTW